ncbi:MAG: GGDEF domain-containing protein [Sulfurovum sp.]|nr:GGDEF domain-containing protein [Sulfurovum sp.]
MLYALYILYKHYNYIRAAYIGSAILYITFLLIAVMEKGEQFTLIWTYFLTPFALITLGTKRGIQIIGSYLMLLFLITYTGIGHWQDGHWGFPSYFRFIASHILMLYVIYTVLDQFEKANTKIAQLRIQEKEQHKMLEQLSQTDPLTGLRNRRSLKERFAHELHYAHTKNRFFAFFLLDVDYFKNFNDTYGHKQGDELLIKIAHAMAKHAGEEHAFRIGGDEFAGLLVAETDEEIKQKIVKLRRDIASLQINFEVHEIEPHATVSIGAHIVNGDNEDFNQVFEHADIALYQAKAQGRDQIVFH